MRYIKRNIDLIGFMTSGLCAVHCLVLPVLLSLGLMNAWVSVEHKIFESVILLLTFIFISISTFRNFIKHQRFSVLLLFAIGLLLLFVGFISGGAYNHVLMAIGGMVVALAHFSSWSTIRISSAEAN